MVQPMISQEYALLWHDRSSQQLLNSCCISSSCLFSYYDQFTFVKISSLRVFVYFDFLCAFWQVMPSNTRATDCVENTRLQNDRPPVNGTLNIIYLLGRICIGLSLTVRLETLPTSDRQFYFSRCNIAIFLPQHRAHRYQNLRCSQ